MADLVSVRNRGPAVTSTEVVKSSFMFKENMQNCIQTILKFNPACQLVLCTLPDPNNEGKGPCDPFKPKGIIKLFNKRILELAADDHLPVADLYAGMMGHRDWFVEGDLHPNNYGHAGMAAIIDAQFGVQPEPTPNSK
jgi:lysophospholipase L1-like esterase